MSHPSGLTVRHFASASRAASALARLIVAELRRSPTLVLGLPTGRTPVPVYARLARAYREGVADFSRAVTFNLDEFVGVGPGDPRGYHAFMRQHLFDHVNVAPRRTRFLDGRAPDLSRECRRYDRQIATAGGIDLMILGLGANGHIGFNEPGASLVAETHSATLTQMTRRANVEWCGGRLVDVPVRALSMGMATIMRSRRIVVLATGGTKATAVRRLVEERITPQVPASFLQLHPAVEIWVDAAAGAQLSGAAS